MQKEVAIGIQSFEEIIEQNYFYIDKTDFIKEWWESGDAVTLITRPRCFGKTLNMSMLEPRDKSDESKYAYILEFKVRNRKEKTLEETVENALKQIEEKQYATELTDRGVDAGRIRKYGFAFDGKKVLIGE